MCADLFDWSPRVYRAVEIDNEVVADVAPAVAFGFRGGMPGTYLLHGEVLALRGGGAMDDDFGYAAHSL